MLFVGRTGSSFITDVLNQHPAVRCESEPLVGWPESDDPAAAQAQFLDWIWGAKALQAHAVCGFKTKTRDVVDLPGFWLAANRHRPLILVSQRQNYLKRIISSLRIGERARRISEATAASSWNEQERNTEVWNVAAGDTGLGAISLDPDEVLRGIAWTHAAVQAQTAVVHGLEASLGLDIVEFDYVELITDSNAFFNRLFTTLGVDPVAFEERLVKHTSDDLAEAVENFAEIRAALIGTEWEYLLSLP